MDQNGSWGDARGRGALVRSTLVTGERGGSVTAVLTRLAALRAEAGDAISSRMGPGAMLAGAVRPRGLHELRESELGRLWRF